MRGQASCLRQSLRNSGIAAARGYDFAASITRLEVMVLNVSPLNGVRWDGRGTALDGGSIRGSLESTVATSRVPFPEFTGSWK